MKKQLVIIIALTVGCLGSHAQLTLNTGNTFTYEFSSLPYVTSVFGPAPEGLFQFSLDGGTLESGDVLRYEMFEGSLATEPSLGPIYSGTVDGPPAPGAWPCIVPGAWQDLQGTVRFTMLQGSVTLNSFELGVLRQGGPTGAQWYYQMVTPIPEPSLVPLVALGFVCLLLPGFRRHAGATLPK